MPFENSNGLTNALEIWLILLIPAALTATYGRMVGNRRQGWAIFGAMSVLFLASVAVVFFAERHATPAQQFAGILHSSGNMEGKEVRFGTAGSALWAAVTTVTSCGAVNAAFESLTALGGVSPFSGLSVSEVVFGGVGSGLYVMLIFVVLAVFIGGLMVGRTPEFLGKKIEAREMKLATLTVLVTPLAVLVTAGAAVASKYGKPSIYASGPQGFSESLYAYLSQANNNGSAFAGYTGYYQPTPGNVGAHGITFADLLGGVTMLGARFLPMILVLAVAGSLAAKRVVAGRRGNPAHRHADVRRPAHRGGAPARSADVLPGHPPGPRGPGPHQPTLLIMRQILRPALVAIVVATIALGIVYPLVVTGISQVVFPGKADGSLIKSHGRNVGSSLLAQPFTKPVLGTNGKPKVDSDGNPVTEPDPRYFQPRPSVTGYNPAGTFFSNRGPNSAVAAYAFRDNVTAYLALEKPYDPGLTAGKIPVDGGHHQRLRRRPAHLAGQRQGAGLPHRLAAQDPALRGPEAHRPEHRRTQPRRARHARRERPQAQPRPRREGTHHMTDKNQPVSLFTGDILRPAILASFAKLDPRIQLRNPVMFVVELTAIIATGAWIKQLAGGAPLGGGTEPSWFTFTVAIWLWLTVVFANLAEALAEGRGKAQADALRSMRADTPARMRDGGDEARDRAARAATSWSSRPARSSPATAPSSRASPRSTSPRSPASPRPSSASPAATAAPSPAARACCRTGSSSRSPRSPGTASSTA